MPSDSSKVKKGKAILKAMNLSEKLYNLLAKAGMPVKEVIVKFKDGLELSTREW